LKKKWTLRKWVLIGYAVLSLLSIVITYALSWLGDDPVSDIPLALLAMFDAAFVAYLGADCVDHWSRNKYKSERVDGDPGDTEGDE